MPLENHPAALMASTLTDIITSVKGSRPTTTTGSGLAVGHVFSQLPVGLMVDPREYKGPWTPAGGTPPEGGVADPAATPDPARTALLVSGRAAASRDTRASPPAPRSRLRGAVNSPGAVKATA